MAKKLKIKYAIKVGDLFYCKPAMRIDNVYAATLFETEEKAVRNIENFIIDEFTNPIKSKTELYFEVVKIYVNK